MTNDLAVSFLTTGSLYVALGQTLVLEATVDKSPDVNVVLVTWERNNPTGSLRLAEYPGRIFNPRVTLEREGEWIRLSDVQESDYGNYTVSVTDSYGTQKHDMKIVLKAEKPPEASVVLLCDVSREEAQWDSPVFTWLVDGVELTNQTANMSDGGSKLHLQGMKGHNYTCISNSSLGTSVSHFIIPECTECPSCSNDVAIAMTIEAMIVLVISVLSCYVLMKQKKLSF
ncbi:uncharacterized protein LOC105901678 isoform X3 [Clupea harengus]|nr:uncharacterized protein LOC105901678 isoform X3 [Clupea harengus]